MKENVLSIGEFARLKGVSVKSLRYYDRIGILKPAYVNKETGYRYYIPEQMILLDIIQLCLTFQLPLKTLPAYQDGRDPALDLKKLITDGQEQAEQKLREAESTLRLSRDIMEQLRRLDSPHREKQIYAVDFPARQLLLCPWDSRKDTAKIYMKKVAALHQRAREAGWTILSQQGIFSEGEAQFVFLAVEDADGGEDVRSLPAGEYACMVLKERELREVPGLLAERRVSPRCTLYLNTDIYDYCLTNHLHWMEVQALR